MIRTLGMVITAIAVLATFAQAASMTGATGYFVVDTPVALSAGGYFGGFDLLPNGNFVISDGYSVREIDATGQEVQTLYTYSGFVYSSFVRYNAANGRVYFGDSSSSSSKIISVAAEGGEASVLTTLFLNYDLDFWGGVPYVSAGDTVYRIDESAGAADAILTTGVVSGPLALDSDGSLIYGTGEWGWPPASNAQSIYRFSAAEVAAAGGGDLLEADQSHTLAANVDGPSGFAFTGTGGLLYSDTITSPGTLRLLSGGVDSVFASCVDPGTDPTTIRYDARTGNISVAVTWFDDNWNRQAVISTLVPMPMPEPSALVSLSGLLICTLGYCERARRRNRDSR